MIDVNEVKDFVEYLTNKKQTGNTTKPDQFNLLLRRANQDIFSWEYGLPEDYKPGQPLPNVAYEVTQKITDDLRVCKEEKAVAVDANGKMLLPSDYIHFTRITYMEVIQEPNCAPVINPRDVEVIDDDKWNKRKTSSIKIPFHRFPICNYNRDSISIMPQNAGTVTFTYLRMPINPVWAFTINANNAAVYDAAGSTNMEWPVEMTNLVARIILKYIGINLGAQDILAYAAQYQATGR